MPGQNVNLSKVSRRSFLIAVTGSALAAAAGCRPQSEGVAPTAYVPGSGATAVPSGAATAAAALPTHAATSGQTGVVDSSYGNVTYDKIMITSADDLYDTQWDYNNTPQIDSSTWSLKIDGLVDNPTTLDYKAIQQFPTLEDMRCLECIGNPVGGNLVGNVVWKGFPIQEILNLVKVQSKATHLKFEAADGYSDSVALEWVTQPGTMMAYMMNGRPLTVKHGFPIRILMPGLYGQKMPRWITHMEFLDHYYQGYWEQNGWSDIASVNTNSMIQTPPNGYSTHAGSQLAIQGVAFAGRRAITKVEVQIDNGDWMPAQLLHGTSSLAWTQWYLTWNPPAPGSYQIGVRATDDTGFTQSQEAGGIFSDASDGTSAIHRISVKAA
ncbi:MAG TPA: molybdopterin-dependent oxidoreductase [Aggregatilineales bacterium]|nr:molybdopterin-dependent oxidoreductase [Aggregatilineales bacterium]